MTLKFNRRAESVAPDYRQAKDVVAARSRIEHIDALLKQANARLDIHAPRIKDAEAALKRAELEAMAGRITDAQLAAAQQVHLDARMADAKDRLLIEDLEAERADLVERKLPAAEHKARVASHAAIRAKAVVLLREMQTSLQAVCQCEAELALLRKEAEAQFDSNIRQEHLRVEIEPNRYEMQPNKKFDPDCEPAAGIPSFVHVNFDRYARMQYSTTISSRNANTLAAIDEALARLDPAK